MGTRRSITAVCWPIAAVCVTLLVGMVVLDSISHRRHDVRNHPLAHAISITNVHVGVVYLADGRAFRPAGITLPADPGAYAAAMQFIRVATKQGVEVRTDLCDGSAMLVCEPRFQSWCGTGHISGMYIPCGLSELLVACGYASVDDHANLLPEESARLRAVVAIFNETGRDANPRQFTEHGIQYDGYASILGQLDEYIEVPPSSAQP
jgi:hypothetical protein